MEISDIQNHLKKHGYLMFEYKSMCYSLQRKATWRGVSYQLVDTDHPPIESHSLEDLISEAHLFDGSILRDRLDHLVVPDSNDPFWETYEAIRHCVVLYAQEIHFKYNNRYYWIVLDDHACLTDDTGNLQQFDSPQELFMQARIDEKTLKEIWEDIEVDAC